MAGKYCSEIAEGIHESARDLFKIGPLSEAEMRDFDRRCLVDGHGAKPEPEFFGAERERLEMGRAAV